MEPLTRRPRKPEHRNAYRALMLALGAMFTDALAARRAIRRALDGGGLDYVLLALRTAPATFGTAQAAVDRQVRDRAAEGVAAFARSRDRCTRPLLRDAADLLRPGIVEQATDRERRAAREVAYNAEKAVEDATKFRKSFQWTYERFKEAAQKVYVNPESAMDLALRFGKAHGAIVLWTEGHKDPLRFGWMRWYPLVDHLRGRFRLKLIAGQGESLVCFRHYAQKVVEMTGDVPSRERLAELQAAADSALAAEAELGPRPPELDPWRAPRRAAGPILDAMRLISPRFPDDAAPEVWRQLVAMLPPDSDTLIDRAIQLAQKQGRDDERHGFRPHLARGL